MPEQKELKDLKLHETLDLFKTDPEEAKVIRVHNGLWYIYISKSTRAIDPIACTSVFVPMTTTQIHKPPNKK